MPSEIINLFTKCKSVCLPFDAHCISQVTIPIASPTFIGHKPLTLTTPPDPNSPQLLSGRYPESFPCHRLLKILVPFNNRYISPRYFFFCAHTWRISPLWYNLWVLIPNTQYQIYSCDRHFSMLSSRPLPRSSLFNLTYPCFSLYLKTYKCNAPWIFLYSTLLSHTIAMALPDTSTVDLRNLTLLQSTTLLHSDTSLYTQIHDEYLDRFCRLVEPYVIQFHAFCNMLCNTASFLTGSTALCFIYSHGEDNREYCKKHYLDIYVRSNIVFEVLLHMISLQDYHIVQNLWRPLEITGNDLFNAPYAHLHGICTVYVLQKGCFKVNIMVSVKDETAIYPVFHFNTTIIMNVLSPNHFACFYPQFTFKRQGLIHYLGFFSSTRQRSLLYRNLGRSPQRHIRKCISRG